LKLLFVSTPGLGHVLPMLGLALAARQRGHTVAWATARDAWPMLQAHGIQTLQAGAPLAQCRAETQQRWPQAPRGGRAQSAHAFAHHFGRVIFDHMVHPLGAAIDEWRPDLVINETAAMAAPLMAHKRDLPHITHAFGLPIPHDILQNASQAVAPSWHSAGLDAPPFAGLYEHGAIEIAPHGLLAAHGHSTPVQRVWHQQAAPAASTDAALPPETVRRFLRADTTRPVVYVTFGTLFDEGPAFAQLLQALAKADVRCVVTSVNPIDAPANANVLMCGYVPQHLLLPHCHAVVSHAGSGTMFGAIAHALPQLCLPQGADQYRNADALATAGAGLVLEDEQVNPTAIAAALHQLLRTPSFCARAQALAAQTTALPTPSDVMAALEHII
jgi:UDP:flavonoid glycosyltransferase YjiC (YdhE family)